MTTKKLSDNEIIASILRGNRRDFSLLIDRYKDKSFALINRILKNKSDSEEVLQDVFLKVFYSLDKFKYESKFSTWLYRIAFNTAITKVNSKTRIREIQLESLDDYENLIAGDIELNLAENSSEFVYKMLDKLPIRNALVLILFHVDRLSLSEISEVLNISIVNVKVLLHRSRNLLRDMLIKYNFNKVEK